MATGATYKVPLKRRRNGRTNYRRRRGLLKSGRIRVVIRKSNNNVGIQFVKAFPDGDKTLVATTTRHLEKYGWKLTGGNLPAAYLVGFLAGKMAHAKDIKSAILDIGLQISQANSRIYAALKGILATEVDVPHSKEVLPDEKLVKGEHIESFSKKLKTEDKKLYTRVYTNYLATKQKPEALGRLVEKVMEKIENEVK